MRLPLVVFAVIAAVIELLPAQARLPDDIYRGPLFMSREAHYVEPKSGAPLEFLNSTLDMGYQLTTSARSKTLFTVDPARVTLRTAFGPTSHGMITFGMTYVDVERNPALRIVPERPPVLLQFAVAPGEITPGPVALKPGMKVVFTLERVARDNGTLLYENPDATELLWEALGRPSPSR